MTTVLHNPPPQARPVTAEPPTHTRIIAPDGHVKQVTVITPEMTAAAERLQRGPLQQPDDIKKAISEAEAKLLGERAGYRGHGSVAQEARDHVPNTLAVLAADTMYNATFEKTLQHIKQVGYGEGYAESTVEALVIRRALEGLSPDERRKAIKKLWADHNAKRRALLREDREHALALKEKIEKRDRLQTALDCIEDVYAWAKTEPRIERPGMSRLPDLRKAAREGRLIGADRETFHEGKPFPHQDYEQEVFKLAEPFVVAHDWAAAFENADLGDAPIRLPYEVCCFEFQFGGRHVMAFATEAMGSICFALVVESGEHWMIFEFLYDARQRASLVAAHEARTEGAAAMIRMFDVVAAQIRAVTIALDAKVAVEEVVRAPHQGQHGKNTHTALRSYHVVSLARRTRAAPLPLDERTPTGRRRRLHFRRGHWRHFESHRTWINWQLVGDPDLGFIDKEYRL